MDLGLLKYLYIFSYFKVFKNLVQNGFSRF
jgi:hypothetical protein